MLDWTTNPLVAAFFAASAVPGAIKVTANLGLKKEISAIPTRYNVDARVVAYRVLTGNIINTKKETDPFVRKEIGILLPRSLTTRIVTQGGIFSVHPEPDRAWEEPFRKNENIFDIPGEMRSFFSSMTGDELLDHPYLWRDPQAAYYGPRRRA